MHKTLFVLFNMILSTAVFSQLTITVQVPESGVILKPQLWNAVITNSYAETKEIYLGVTISDAATGDPVFTGTTPYIFVSAGATPILESNVSPVTYDYLSADINDRNPEGYLPAGSYTACYTIFLLDENAGTAVAEQCVPVVVDPVSPPILNIPFDQQVIYNPNPQFSWIPPTPMEIYSNLNYDFVLVEVQDGQSPADAIQQNLPVYATNTTDIFLNYPSSEIDLDTGKIYAWQITAKNNEQYSAQSDIWTFSLGDTVTQSSAKNPSQYPKLKRTLDASIAVEVDSVLAYYENDEDTLVQYNIYDVDPNSQDDSGEQLMTTGQLAVTPGINLISIPLDQVGSMTDSKQYLFQIYNSRGETWSLKFIYYKKD